jgi:hypothetical protein
MRCIATQSAATADPLHRLTIVKLVLGVRDAKC